MDKVKKDIWFKDKTYGIFEMDRPLTWQGWLVTVIYCIIMIFPFLSLDLREVLSQSDNIVYIYLGVPTILYFAILIKKRGNARW